VRFEPRLWFRPTARFANRCAMVQTKSVFLLCLVGAIGLLPACGADDVSPPPTVDAGGSDGSHGDATVDSATDSPAVDSTTDQGTPEGGDAEADGGG
jgi:hypothetical protein